MTDGSLPPPWERSVGQRILLIVAGVAFASVGAYGLLARRSDSPERPVTGAILMGVLGLTIGVLYATGIPVMAPSSAPTAPKARAARAARWPLGFFFIGTLVWVAVTSGH